MQTFNGFLPGDLSYTPEERADIPSVEERIRAIDDSPLSAEALEARELHDFIELSGIFDVVMSIERKVEHTQHGRDRILWAARRNLHGVKLPTKPQLLALWAAAPKSV